MEISLYLAMTAAEISAGHALPANLAYMACHFSPYGAGLSNIPENLPTGSVLILNDRTPICGHDHHLVANQLSHAMQALECSSLLLDFQRPDNPETAELCRFLTQVLSFPVGISTLYATGLECAVFLPPCPLDRPVSDYLSPWNAQPLWLDVSSGGLQITVDQKGTHYANFPCAPETELPFEDPELLCHYRIELTEASALFTLSRTQEDIRRLMEKAQAFGVTQCFGLWQELSK